MEKIRKAPVNMAVWLGSAREGSLGDKKMGEVEGL